MQSRTIARSLRAGEGFLSQSSKTVHFGFTRQEQPQHLVIRWPDGSVESFQDLQPNSRIQITQGQQGWQPLVRGSDAGKQFPADARDDPRLPVAAEKSVDARRIVIASLPKLPELPVLNQQLQRRILRPRDNPLLIQLWASWCPTCLSELKSFSGSAKSLAQVNLSVVAVSVDLLDDSSAPQQQAKNSASLAAKLSYPYPLAFATKQFANRLDIVRRALFDRHEPLPLPLSLLVDSQNRLAVIYVGRVEPETVLNDLEALQEALESEHPRKRWRQQASPFLGRWWASSLQPDPVNLAMQFISEGYPDQASIYLRSVLKADPTSEVVGVEYFLARLLLEQGKWSQAEQSFRRVLAVSPNHPGAHLGLGFARLSEGRANEAVAELLVASELMPAEPEPDAYLGMARIRQGQPQLAIKHYRQALQKRPGWTELANNLAWMLATHASPQVRNPREAIKIAQAFCQSDPDNPSLLDTLAAAWAADGNFDKAIEVAENAVRFARQQRKTKLAASIQARLETYQQGQAFVEIEDSQNP